MLLHEGTTDVLAFDFLLKDPVPDTPAVAGAIKSQFLCAPKGSISY